MKVLVKLTGTGTFDDPFRPDIPQGVTYRMLADGSGVCMIDCAASDEITADFIQIDKDGDVLDAQKKAFITTACDGKLDAAKMDTVQDAIASINQSRLTAVKANGLG